MSKFVGIDLGTTYSAISILNDLGRPEIISVDSERITPSVIFFDEDDDSNVLVGSIAKNKLSDEDDAKRVIQDVKRHMGEEKNYLIDGKNYNPSQISSFILKKLTQEASEIKGTITEAVITVPANFSEKERKATMDAGELAGINVKHIINEPTAAAIYYASQSPLTGNILIYDLGGGTFDVTLAKINVNNVEVVASSGDRHLGGKDFDMKLVELFQNKYKEVFGEKLAITELNREEYLHKAEDIKLNLTKKASQKIKLKGSSGNTQVEITRIEFEEAISTFLAKTELLIDSVLDEANWLPSDVNQILLVGGSSRIPAVSKSLKKIFNKDPLKSVNPDEAVTLGAAIYAGLNADTKKLTSAQSIAMEAISLTEVCNDYFGTTAMFVDKATGREQLQVSIILEKNTPLPCSKTEIFCTKDDGQTKIQCDVTQSKAPETDPQFVTVIWDGTLELPPGRPKGQPLEIIFSYDTNGRMHCRYKDVNSGLEQEANLTPESKQQLDNDKASVDDFMIE